MADSGSSIVAAVMHGRTGGRAVCACKRVACACERRVVGRAFAGGSVHIEAGLSYIAKHRPCDVPQACIFCCCAGDDDRLQ